MTTVGIEVGSSSDQERCCSCLKSWLQQQRTDLEQLLQGLKGDTQDIQNLCLLVETHMKHFNDHCTQRAILAQQDAPFFFCPTCDTTFENSYLWLAGCRPSQLIRLVYTLCGYHLESRLEEVLDGERKGDLAELSPTQLRLVNELHLVTVVEEDKLSTLMASLQEDIADQPLALLAYDANNPAEVNETVDQAIQRSALALASILEEADKLRLSTLISIINILTPLQAVDFLVAGLKLHIAVHDWGVRRDDQLKGDNSMTQDK